MRAQRWPVPHPPSPLFLTCRLFQYSPTRLLDSVPTMFAFPKLSEVFGTIASRIPATVRTGAVRGGGVRAGGAGGAAARAAVPARVRAHCPPLPRSPPPQACVWSEWSATAAAWRWLLPMAACVALTSWCLRAALRRRGACWGQTPAGRWHRRVVPARGGAGRRLHGTTALRGWGAGAAAAAARTSRRPRCPHAGLSLDCWAMCATSTT